MKKVSCYRLRPSVAMSLTIGDSTQTDGWPSRSWQAVTEVMKVIGTAQTFVWENKMDDQVAELREEELVYQRRLLLQPFRTIVSGGIFL